MGEQPNHRAHSSHRRQRTLLQTGELGRWLAQGAEALELLRQVGDAAVGHEAQVRDLGQRLARLRLKVLVLGVLREPAVADRAAVGGLGGGKEAAVDRAHGVEDGHIAAPGPTPSGPRMRARAMLAVRLLRTQTVDQVYLCSSESSFSLSAMRTLTSA